MPKVGQEPRRRAALVAATIAEIGAAGSLDVTVGRIARRAGMSAALAHYYFDTKGAIFHAAMRHILGAFGRAARAGLVTARTPRERLDAIVAASLGPDQFQPEIVSAWLVFYVEAQRDAAAARLLRIYARRLHSNLVHELARLMPRERAEAAARGTGAMIDGFYIRHALGTGGPDAAEAVARVREYLDFCISRGRT